MLSAPYSTLGTEVEQAIRLRRNTATWCASWSATRSCFDLSRADLVAHLEHARRNPNERNAIIQHVQHGMMTLARRSLRERIGWAEWCITDAELGGFRRDMTRPTSRRATAEV